MFGGRRYLSSSHHDGSKPLNITLKHIALLENHKTFVKCRSGILPQKRVEQINNNLARPDNCELQGRHSGPAQYSRNYYFQYLRKPDRCSGAGGEFAVATGCVSIVLHALQKVPAKSRSITIPDGWPSLLKNGAAQQGVRSRIVAFDVLDLA
jgi:hypothetical protein